MAAVASAQPAALRVVVADADPPALRRLTRLLAAVPGVAVVAACTSAAAALDAVRAGDPDVLYLDVTMPDMDGLALARRVGAPRSAGGRAPLVVCVAADAGRAVEAFQARAADYLLKPVAGDRLAESVAHARTRVEDARAGRRLADAAARITLRDGGRVHIVTVADLLWIESCGNYARVHTTRERFLHRATLTHLADTLARHGFLRVHRTAIVNGRRLTAVRSARDGQWRAVLDTGHRLRVSRRYRDAMLGRVPAPRDAGEPPSARAILEAWNPVGPG